MEKVPVVREYNKFYGCKRLSQDYFFRWFTLKKLSQYLCLICCYILQKISQKRSNVPKKCGHKKNPRYQMCGFLSLQRHIPWGFYHGGNLIFKHVTVRDWQSTNRFHWKKIRICFFSIASNVRCSVI